MLALSTNFPQGKTKLIHFSKAKVIKYLNVSLVDHQATSHFYQMDTKLSGEAMTAEFLMKANPRLKFL